MYNIKKTELYHHGILGMKWGVRRYQNADGSLTEAGRKRYGNGTTTYGNVKVTKKDNGYQITDYERETYVDPLTLRVMSENADDMLVKDVANWMGVKYNQAEKWLDNLSEPQIKEINNMVEDYMEMTLSMVLKSSLGKDVKTSNGKDIKTSNSPKPKYTQEQAIEKAYSDLEKKYSNFDDLPLEKQDELFIDYVNESGLYEYI